MKPKFPQPLLSLTSLLVQTLLSSANTEILNLTPTVGHRTPTLDSISLNWPVLTPAGGQNERQWSMVLVPPQKDTEDWERAFCEDDLWLVLDFDSGEWSAYKSFTLRVSWPASVCIPLSVRSFFGCRISLSASQKSTLIFSVPSASPSSTRLISG